MDPFHVPILHGSFSGNQFNARMAIMPKVTFENTTRGIRSVQLRDKRGAASIAVSPEAVPPTIRAVAEASRGRRMGRARRHDAEPPIDDTSFPYLFGRACAR